MKLLLLDCDGVLGDFAAAARPIIHEVSGSLEGISDGNVFAHLSDEHRLECRRRTSVAGWCSSIPPFEDALRAWGRLRARFKVEVVTAPYHTPTWCHERVEWLGKHFGLDRDDVHFSSRKFRVEGDIFIDDHVANVLPWQRRWRNSVGIVWAHPYNEFGPHGMLRHRSWERVLELA